MGRKVNDITSSSLHMRNRSVKKAILRHEYSINNLPQIFCQNYFSISFHFDQQNSNFSICMLSLENSFIAPFWVCTHTRLTRRAEDAKSRRLRMLTYRIQRIVRMLRRGVWSCSQFTQFAITEERARWIHYLISLEYSHVLWTVKTKTISSSFTLCNIKLSFCLCVGLSWDVTILRISF